MPTVLIVDDSLIDRELAGGLLSREGHWKIDFAGDGAEALARVEESLPDIVVTDLQMPNTNGLELTAAMRKRFPHVPVILVTAHGSESLAIEALNQGAASYVPKSQLADKLCGVVEQMLAMSRRARR